MSVAVGAEGRVLILTEGQKNNVYLSARNLQGVEVKPFGEESTYDVLLARTLGIERGALDATTRATGIWQRVLEEQRSAPVLDGFRVEALERFIARRTSEGGAPPES